MRHNIHILLLAALLAVLPACTKTEPAVEPTPDPVPEVVYVQPEAEKILLAAGEAKTETNGAVREDGCVTVFFAEAFTYGDKAYEQVAVEEKYVSHFELLNSGVFIVFGDSKSVNLPYQGDVELDIDATTEIKGYPGGTASIEFKVVKLGRGTVKFTVKGEKAFYPEVVYDEATHSGHIDVTFNKNQEITEHATIIVSDGVNKRTYAIDATTYHFRITGTDSVELGCNAGDDAAINVVLDTDSPDCFLAVRTEGEFFTLSEDNKTVVARNVNLSDDPLEGSVVFYDGAGMFDASKQVSVSQAYCPPTNKEGCIPFESWAFKKAAVAVADKDGDGEVSPAEAMLVKELNLSGLGLRSVNELKYFKRLEKLDCSNNRIAVIDLGDIASFAFLRDINVENNLPDTNVDISGCWPGVGLKYKGNSARCIDYDYPNLNLYTSTDLSLAGFELLQEHTKGHGIMIELRTQLFDLDYMSGAARSWIDLYFEGLFSIEPLKSLREYFDVYWKKELDVKTPDAFIDYYEIERAFYYNGGFCLNIEAVLLDLYCGDETGGISHCHGSYRKGYDKSSSYSCSICMKISRRSLSEYQIQFHWDLGYIDILQHELGHAIGGLGDQYKSQSGSGVNYTTNGDITQAPWKRFFDISRYDGRVGFYEKFDNVFFPSKHSLMDSTYNHEECDLRSDFFDSVSRYSIFENVIQMANQTTDFRFTIPEEDVWQMFLEYDVINDAIPY